MRKKLLVDGMSCMNCVRHLKEALQEDIKGLEVIDVSLENKCALVEVNDNVSDDMIKAVIDDLGYELKGIE
ncbi:MULTISPECIES: heavy-metal-associated domain-containing protein [Paraclostridium]|jgi:copper chaperone|uniref:Heavy-metal-associated domain-containing protein n=1 Tax=Paraclostridium bifermentans TaxID=1490 RepID=A0AA44DLE2_PARBF|nr:MULTISPECIES: heavy metal-associated domain-containing protein [Paraclostridium]KGJ50934.1 heavy metal-associated domain protein [Clostridium sp. NCR]MBN8046234.1 heavy-metal-associated domain-containing protein [Paraclostridium bifermentans]MBS5953292.1 heavy-metal-associated domain-containing protein [Paraclostridium bifermentans]MBS6506589.1 heavy-metal-associated domain-containing protein [Paraclostridium bifermentans]MBU5288516.1 heavy-metal-associated domain-containing protein [Paracl